MFRDRLPLAQQYAALLTGEGVVRGLLGPREAARIWERHLLNCAVLGEAVAEGAEVCDVGSGAGLPGIVLALARPDLRVTLVEPLLRRTRFLEEVVAALALTNAEVVRARADDLDSSRQFQVVTSRAVAPFPRLLRWSAPLVRPGGVMLAIKGATADTEVAGAAAELEALHAEAEVVRLGVGLLYPPTTVVRTRFRGVAPLGLDMTASTRKGQRPRPGARRGKR